MLAILVPVLGREHQIDPLLESIAASTKTDYRVVFICSPSDPVREVCLAREGDTITVSWEPDRADFAKKINYAYGLIEEEWYFQAATDLVFQPSWDTRAFHVAHTSRCGVIGTNDLGNPSVKKGHHSTHILFSRAYIEEYGGTFDGSGAVFSEAYDHQFCNPPEAPIWMGDLSFRALGDIRAGDTVMGWRRRALEADTQDIRDADGSHRTLAARFGISASSVQKIKSGFGVSPRTMNRLEPSRVLNVSRRDSDLVRVVMASGREFRCTPDHRWLNACWSPSTRHDAVWVTPAVGRILSHVIDHDEATLSVEDTRLAGWLGGIFDGEGSWRPNPSIGQDVHVNPLVYNEICRALDHFGFPYTRAENCVWLRGGRRELVRFVNLAQPARREHLATAILGTSRFGQRDKVVNVIPDGRGEVVSLTTETGNYVAWGYASRNCDTELVQTATLRGQFKASPHSIVEHMHPHWGKGEMDDTYLKSERNFREDMVIHNERMRKMRREMGSRPSRVRR